MAPFGFLIWRFIQNKARTARDSDLAAFKESLLNPSKEQAIICKPDKNDTKGFNENDTASTGNSSNHSGNEGSAIHIGTPRSDCTVPDEMALSRETSLCKTYDEHIALLTPRPSDVKCNGSGTICSEGNMNSGCEVNVEEMDEKSQDPSLSLPMKLPPKVRTVQSKVPKLDIPHSLTVANHVAPTSMTVAHRVIFLPGSQALPNDKTPGPSFVKTCSNDKTDRPSWAERLD